MPRAAALFLGAGLGLVGWTGLLSRYALDDRWMAWLIVLLAALSFFYAFFVAPSEKRWMRGIVPLLISCALFVLFFASLIEGIAIAWLVWWSYLFAGAYLYFGISELLKRPESEC